jgi:hypothetical protein
MVKVCTHPVATAPGTDSIIARTLSGLQLCDLHNDSSGTKLVRYEIRSKPFRTMHFEK